jgi:outer membrane immunogenic protein
MKHLLLATTALAAVAIASQASAADLGTAAPAYTKAPVYAPVSNWSGWYIGGNVGYGWGDGETNFAGLPDPVAFQDLQTTRLNNKPQGVLGGGQLGYNWQIGSIVTGLEADFQGSNIKGSATLSPFNELGGLSNGPLSSLTSTQKLSWFGTVRGRFGVAVIPDLLLYGTGGLAYGHVEGSANLTFNPLNQFNANLSETRAGWVAGVGAEWKFVRNWSAKFEYLYMDLGNASAVGQPTRLSNVGRFAVANDWNTKENLVRVGVNYHFN